MKGRSKGKVNHDYPAAIEGNYEAFCDGTLG